jgi:hypothetical protein
MSNLLGSYITSQSASTSVPQREKACLAAAEQQQQQQQQQQEEGREREATARIMTSAREELKVR